MSASAARVPPAWELARLCRSSHTVRVCVCVRGCFTGSMKEFLTERHVEPPRRSGHWTGTAAQTNRGRPGESGELSEPERSFNVTATLARTAARRRGQRPALSATASPRIKPLGEMPRTSPGRPRSDLDSFCFAWGGSKVHGTHTGISAEIQTIKH